MPAMQFVMYGTILSILWFGGGLINTGKMEVGELTGFLSYVLQILNSLMMISNVFLDDDPLYCFRSPDYGSD